MYNTTQSYHRTGLGDFWTLESTTSQHSRLPGMSQHRVVGMGTVGFKLGLLVHEGLAKTEMQKRDSLARQRDTLTLVHKKRSLQQQH